MKKGLLIFIISFVFVSAVFDSALADDPKRNGGQFSYIDVKGNLYCALKVPSADSLYQENLAICVTKDGYVASTDEALLDQAVFLASSGDELAFSRFLDENPLVFILKGNLLAKIEERSWPGKVKIRLLDFEFLLWTVKEAVEITGQNL